MYQKFQPKSMKSNSLFVVEVFSYFFHNPILKPFKKSKEKTVASEKGNTYLGCANQYTVFLPREPLWEGMRKPAFFMAGEHASLSSKQQMYVPPWIDSLHL